VSLGDRIRMAREDAGMSQADLARSIRSLDDRLSKTDSTRISEWERGKTRRIPFHAVVAIAHATQKPLEYFAAGGAS
jgi:transcriptional regulator with XRE-family HTH domain